MIQCNTLSFNVSKKYKQQGGISWGVTEENALNENQ